MASNPFRLLAPRHLLVSWRVGLSPRRGQTLLDRLLLAFAILLCRDGLILDGFGALFVAGAALFIVRRGLAQAAYSFDSRRLDRWAELPAIPPAQGLALARRALSDEPLSVGRIDAARFWERSRFDPSEPVLWTEHDLLGAWRLRSGTFLDMLKETFGAAGDGSGFFRGYFDDGDGDGPRILGLCLRCREESEIFEACPPALPAHRAAPPRL